MKKRVFAEMIETEIKGVVETDCPIGLLSSFKAGGEADIVVYPTDIDDLKKVVAFAKKEAIPLSVFGLGSNLLVRDGGVRGIVVNLGKGFNEIRLLENNRISCGAGASLASLIAFAAARGMGGLEFLAGIPGTVGGAVKMNAGAFGAEIRDVVEDVTFLNELSEIATADQSKLSFSYRNLACAGGEIICGATFNTKKTEMEDIKRLMKEYAVKRAKSQPLEKLTAGSVFKNPQGDFAGRLIEEAGLKGMSIGDALVSEKHANFIENRGKARSSDIISLMELVKKKVFENSGVMLHEEIIVVGEDAPEIFGKLH